MTKLPRTTIRSRHHRDRGKRHCRLRSRRRPLNSPIPRIRSETYIGAGATVRSIDVDRWGANMTVYLYDRNSKHENACVTSVAAVSGLKQRQQLPLK